MNRSIPPPILCWKHQRKRGGAGLDIVWLRLSALATLLPILASLMRFTTAIISFQWMR